MRFRVWLRFLGAWRRRAFEAQHLRSASYLTRARVRAAPPRAAVDEGREEGFFITEGGT
jgi:hypothetical protein